MEDPAELDFFTYDGEVDLPRVIVSGKMEVEVQNFGDHINIIPIKFDDHAQFEKYALACIIKAHEIAGKTFETFQDAGAHISHTWECGPVNVVLASKADILNQSLYDAVESALGKGVHIFTFSDINRGEAYALPDSNYLGVISENISDKNNELHGIGIINTKAVAKVVWPV